MAEPASIEPAPAACFQTGDVVVLKSGGPMMTVEKLSSDPALTSVSWFVTRDTLLSETTWKNLGAPDWVLPAVKERYAAFDSNQEPPQ